MIGAVTITCLTAALLLTSWFWRPQGVERGVRILIAGYAALGAWSLWFVWYAPGQEPAAVLIWKPTILFWMLGITVLGAPLLGWGYPFKAIFGTFFIMSNRVWRNMNLAAGLVFAIFGTLNVLAFTNMSHGDWEGFKYSCRVLLMFFILLRLNFVWLEIVSRVGIYWYGRFKGRNP